MSLTGKYNFVFNSVQKLCPTITCVFILHMIKSVYSKMAQFTLYYTPSSTPSRTVLMLIKNMDLNVEVSNLQASTSTLYTTTF